MPPPKHLDAYADIAQLFKLARKEGRISVRPVGKDSGQPSPGVAHYWLMRARMYRKILFERSQDRGDDPPTSGWNDLEMYTEGEFLVLSIKETPMPDIFDAQGRRITPDGKPLRGHDYDEELENEVEEIAKSLKLGKGGIKLG